MGQTTQIDLEGTCTWDIVQESKKSGRSHKIVGHRPLGTHGEIYSVGLLGQAEALLALLSILYNFHGRRRGAGV